MATTPPALFSETLKTSLDVTSISQYFRDDRTGKTEAVLRRLRPEGSLDGGRYKLASVEGGSGGSFDFNMQSHQWGDWGTGNQVGGWGLVDFVSAAMRCSTAQAVKFLVDEKFLVAKEAKKSLSDNEGNPPVLPIPEEKQSWEYVLEQDVLRKDRGILRNVWTYRDLDGSLLFYKYRVDDRNNAKEVYTLSYRAETEWTKKPLAKKVQPAYGLEYIRQGPTVRMLLVEGEKAADRARELLGNRWKVLGYSGVTGAADLWIPDEKFWEDCEVVLWPDNDLPGREAARKVQLHLEKLTHKPREVRIARVEAIPGLPPGWDIGDWEEGCPVDLKVELDRAEEVDSFERISRQWVYVSQQDQFHNLEDRGLVWSPTAFDRRYSRYGDKTGSPSKKFLSALDTLKVDDLEFIPGEGTFVESSAGKVFLNEWYPTPTYTEAQVIAGDPNITDADIARNARYFVEHISRICGDSVAEPDRDVETGEIIPGTENRPVVDALATFFSKLIRRPMDKLGWVPLMVSNNNGTGKSYFLNMVESILGGPRTTALTVKEYIGQYDDWRDGLLFYELGEAKYHENTEVYEQIKKNHNHKPFEFAKQTDRMAGSQKLNIKTRGMKNQRDFLNGFITSNNLFPLALSSGAAEDGSDRRLFVIRCEQRLTRQQADNLFQEIVDRPEWVGAWLMRYTAVHNWNPGWAPITEHKRVMFEKDRERAESRSDKYELGKYDEFFHFVEWARKDKVGGFGRLVVTGQNVREMCENKHIKFPYQAARFDKILERAGLLKGPDLLIDGEFKRMYTSDPDMLAKDDKEWRAEYSKSINGKL
jgi:hypothetical protein